MRGLYPGLCKPAFWDCPGRRLGYSPGRTAGQGGQPAGGCLRHHPNPSPCAGCGQGAPHGPPRRALRGRPHLGGGYGHRLSQGFAGGKDSRAGDRGGCQAFPGLSQLPGRHPWHPQLDHLPGAAGSLRETLPSGHCQGWAAGRDALLLPHRWGAGPRLPEVAHRAAAGGDGLCGRHRQRLQRRSPHPRGPARGGDHGGGRPAVHGRGHGRGAAQRARLQRRTGTAFRHRQGGHGYLGPSGAAGAHSQVPHRAVRAPLCPGGGGTGQHLLRRGRPGADPPLCPREPGAAEE